MKNSKSIALCVSGFFISFFSFLCGDRFFGFYLASEGSIVDKLLPSLESTFQSPFFIFFKTGIKGGLFVSLFTTLLFIVVFCFDVNYKRRDGEEQGSAEWGTAKDIKPFINQNEDANILLTKTESLSLERPKDFEYDRNGNVLIIGGSGSGKTRGFVTPNIMQMYGSYVITDPKGTLLPQVGTMLEENGYKVKTFNTINFGKSMHYNPLAYIRSEKDILKVVNVLIENTKGEGEKAGEDFWTKSERLLYCALIAYLREECNPEEMMLSNLIKLLDCSDVKEENEAWKNQVDFLFDDLEKKNPNSFALRQYKKYKKAAGKTAKSILISCGARLAPFDIKELQEITAYDEMELDKIGDEKTALFLIMSDTDKTFSFIMAMIYYQMFNLLCEHADDDCGGELPIPVRCILDEFRNIGRIPEFQILISTIRSRRISANIIVQSIAQIEEVYDKAADTIVDNCDTTLFLGGKSPKTTKMISESIGKETIKSQTVNKSGGSSTGWSMNNSIIGRDLIDPAEIAKLSKKKCILQIYGLPPFKSTKCDMKQHKNYKLLAKPGSEREYKLRSKQDQEYLDFIFGKGYTEDSKIKILI